MKPFRRLTIILVMFLFCCPCVKAYSPSSPESGRAGAGSVASGDIEDTDSLQAVRALPLNDKWKFTLEGDNSEQIVNLPHTWNATDAQNHVRKPGEDPKKNPLYKRCKGTYLRSLKVPYAWKGRKRVFVRFETAGQTAEVYLNDKLVGKHKGAFTAFCIELTADIEYGAENTLKVEVDNRWRADLAPISGGFAVMGGLYRQAELIVTDQLCISPLFYGSRGVFVDTDNSGDVKVRTHLHYGRYTDGRMTTSVPYTEATVETVVRDASGCVVAKTTKQVRCVSGNDEVVVSNLHVDNPVLWHGKKSPRLYTACVRITSPQGNDEQTVTFGFREISLGKGKGFMINGETYPVHGVSRHQDMRDKGWALTHDDNLADMKMMDEMGVTAIRMAHYPQSEDIHHIADSMGFVVWDEIPLVNDVRNTHAFKHNAREMMLEMMYQLYNHPSVCWWGLFNEIDYPETPYPKTLFNSLNELAHKEGGNRLTASASNKGRRYYNGIADAPAWNNYPGWYWMLRWPKEENNKGRVGGFGEWLDYRSAELGGRPFGISEYGAGGNPDHHLEGKLPEQFEKTLNALFHPEEWQNYVHEEVWRVIDKNQDKLYGSFVWAMFDFIVPGWNEGGMLNLNTKGLVTHDRKVKKDAFYFYKANWTAEPLVYICSRRNVERTLAKTDIKIYSNCEKVSLYINGKKVGTLVPDEIRMCTFAGCTLKKGKNDIMAVGVKGKKKFKDSCRFVFNSK